jgi:hypothetical protein
VRKPYNRNRPMDPQTYLLLLAMIFVIGSLRLFGS